MTERAISFSSSSNDTKYKLLELSEDVLNQLKGKSFAISLAPDLKRPELPAYFDIRSIDENLDFAKHRCISPLRSIDFSRHLSTLPLHAVPPVSTP